MSDLRHIVQTYDSARLEQTPCVLATVVRTAGSTYRKPGARRLLCADGRTVGVVSGGCLEADVARRAWFLRDPGDSELVRYDTASDSAAAEFGLGCRGLVEVVLRRLAITTAEPVIECLRRVVDTREPIRLVTSLVPPHAIKPIDALVDTRLDSRFDDCLIESIAPPIRLLIFGSGIDVRPLVAIARDVGWVVHVIDRPSMRLASLARAEPETVSGVDPADVARTFKFDPRTACVIMTHRLDDDAAYLRVALASSSSYVGVLGPRARFDAIVATLDADRSDPCDPSDSCNPSDVSRVHAPIGLNLGGESPQEIALSIVAEVQATMHRTTGRSLCELDGPIHG